MTTRPFADLSSSGLLWLVNTSVFHPRGYAMALVFDEDGTAVGWELQGDGSEVWMFGEEMHAQFEAAQRTLAPRQVDP